MTGPSRIGVLALGQPHQLMHLLGPARALARLGCGVDVLVTSHWHEELIARHAPDAAFRTVRLRGFRAHGAIHDAPNRMAVLGRNAHDLSGYGCLLVAELTSTWLKRIGLFRAILAIVPHGAGDRAETYDPRYRFGDLVFAPGEKLRSGLVERGLVDPARCAVTGYPRFDLLDSPPPRFFEDGRKVILYNPHFSRTLSSWPGFGEDLAEAVARQADLAMIVAPHIRISGAMRRQIQALAAAPPASNLIIDPGSIHSINMDYARSADIYLGDVSSQVYEFLRTPRPCVFANPRSWAWRNTPSLQHWQFGEVVSCPQTAIAALRRARARHGEFRDAQREGLRTSIAQIGEPASEKIARRLLSYLPGAGDHGI